MKNIGIWLVLVLFGWLPALGQVVKYGNNETSNYSSSYKSNGYTYLLWDLNDGGGHFVDYSTPKFIYWDNEENQLNYLLDTGNMGQLNALFNSAIVGNNNDLSGVLEGEGWFQSNSPLSGSGFVTTPWIYARAIEGDSRGSRATLITLGSKNGITKSDEIGLVTKGKLRMIVNPDGNIGVGTSNPSSKLTISGTTKTKEVIVEEDVGADFVFEGDYPLPELSDLKSFIQSNKHLPEIPSAEEMKRDGVKMGALQMKLLQKIEELTLYVIDLNKRNEEQQEIIQQQQKEINQLRKKLQTIVNSRDLSH